MNFPLFIARKIYSGGDRKNKVSKPAIRIATLGVALGLAVMIISIGVVLGFKHSIRNKVVGFGSHIIVTNFLTLESSQQHAIQIDKAFLKKLGKIKGVKHAERYAYIQGVLKTDEDFLGVVFKGIGQEYDTTFLHQNMVAGKLPKFSDETSHQKIVVSKTIADKLRLKVGQSIYAYFINQQGVRTRRFKIEGIYATNMKQFDSQFCFTDIYAAQKLNGWEHDQCSGAELLIGNFNTLPEVARNVLQQVKGTVDNYGQTYASDNIINQYPQIFTWLDLMDMNVWIILALMISVAGVTMISGLLIIILERTQMIGIMKALGARNNHIRHVFLWFASFIISRGLIWGNIIGIGLILLQQYTGWIKLDPQTYYVETIPVEINIPLILAVNIATLLICVFVLIGPSYLVSRINPSKSMHYE